MSLNDPFLLAPAGKDYLWGGRRLKDYFGKENIRLDPLAETWGCSTHPNGPSTVASGEFKGKLLSDVIEEHPEILGTHPQAPKGQIPILVKFIDAKRDLSIQVHPSDEYAKTHENGQLGKTEMWYVVDAAPGASLIYGFRHKMTKELIRCSALDGSIENYLNRVPAKKNDVFVIHSGTVHAIGAGALVAEIQESSDLTYRLYDYNRVDKNGNKRPLHIDKALDVVNLEAVNEPRQALRVLRYQKGRATELLARNKYFMAERMLINTENTHEMASFQSGSYSFRALLCYAGCGTILSEEDNFFLPFFKGDCIFVPANSVPLKIHGKAEMLNIRC